MQLAVTDADDPFKALTEDLSNLRDQNAVQEELSAESFTDLDNNVVTAVLIFSDEDIVVEILDPDEDYEIDKDIDEVVAEGPNRPSNIELEEPLDKL